MTRTTIARIALLTVIALVGVASIPLRPTLVEAAGFSFNWNGDPAAPLAWNPSSGFALFKHDRDVTNTYDNPYSVQAQHGADCGPFSNYGPVGGTHTVATYADETYICNNHLMTTLNGEGYSEITFTPAELLDWSQGPAVATWRVSTFRATCRDWLAFDLMPFADNLPLVEGAGADLMGEARNELQISNGGSCSSTYNASDIRNFNSMDLPQTGNDVLDVVSPSAATRTLFQLTVSSTHVSLTLPEHGNYPLVDADLVSPLPYNQAVLQFSHNSYDPTKECDPTPTFCHEQTWHWSDLTYSTTAPFTILNADEFQVDAASPTVHLPAPAPAGSWLRMEELSAVGSMTATTDTGQVVNVDRSQPSTLNQDGSLQPSTFNMTWLPIPAGTQSLTFSASDDFVPWLARNISVWSMTAPTSPSLGPHV